MTCEMPDAVVTFRQDRPLIGGTTFFGENPRPAKTSLDTGIEQVAGHVSREGRWGWDGACLERASGFCEDPSGFGAGDANLYRYVGNSPTNATDPSGLAPNEYTGPSIQADTRSWWQRTKDWFRDVWNCDFIDPATGGGARPLDDMFTSIVRQAIHQNIKPISGGVVDTGKFVVVDVPVFVYDNSLGIPLQGLDRTIQADKRRLTTLKATGELIANWDQVPDYMAGRMVQRVAAGAATSYGMGIAAGRAISVLGDTSRVSVVGEGSAPMTGYTWNQVLQARYGAENVTWVQPRLPSKPLTLGVLRTPAGDFDLASGWSGYGSMMPKGSPGFDIVTRTHVEGQAAALMQRQGIGEGLLYTNNPIICPNCTRNLPYMLGPGRTLQIVLPKSTPVPFTGVAR